MTTLDKIQLLMTHIKDEGVARSYRIIDGTFWNLHHGWHVQFPCAYTTEEELKTVLDNLVLIFANEMRVHRSLVFAGLNYHFPTPKTI